MQKYDALIQFSLEAFRSYQMSQAMQICETFNQPRYNNSLGCNRMLRVYRVSDITGNRDTEQKVNCNCSWMPSSMTYSIRVLRSSNHDATTFRYSRNSVIRAQPPSTTCTNFIPSTLKLFCQPYDIVSKVNPLDQVIFSSTIVSIQ